MIYVTFQRLTITPQLSPDVDVRTTLIYSTAHVVKMADVSAGKFSPINVQIVTARRCVALIRASFRRQLSNHVITKNSTYN